jgi:hypothetical protein
MRKLRPRVRLTDAPLLIELRAQTLWGTILLLELHLPEMNEDGIIPNMRHLFSGPGTERSGRPPTGRPRGPAGCRAPGDAPGCRPAADAAAGSAG